MSLPILIHRYLPQCKTVQQPPGFADFLKGTAYLYQQTLVGLYAPAFELVVDFSHHPMGVFIQPIEEQIQKYQQHVVRTDVQVMECFNQNRPVIRNIVTSYQTSPVAEPPLKLVVEGISPSDQTSPVAEPPLKLVVEGISPSDQTSPVAEDPNVDVRRTVALGDDAVNVVEASPPVTYAVCHEPYEQFDSNDFVLDASAQAYMKSVLNFVPELYENADDMLEQMGLKDREYVVIHLRMGDQQSAQQNAYVQQLVKVEAYIQHVLIPKWGNRILVISDSYYTKKYLCNKYELCGTDIQPVHMGEAKRFLNRSEAASPTDIGNTLIEFILMSRCKSIFLYSVYGWNSGFSKLCGHIYQIPYVVIEQQQI